MTNRSNQWRVWSEVTLYAHHVAASTVTRFAMAMRRAGMAGSDNHEPTQVATNLLQLKRQVVCLRSVINQNSGMIESRKNVEIDHDEQLELMTITFLSKVQTALKRIRRRLTDRQAIRAGCSLIHSLSLCPCGCCPLCRQ
jgi:hypothetical protein